MPVAGSWTEEEVDYLCCLVNRAELTWPLWLHIQYKFKSVLNIDRSINSLKSKNSPKNFRLSTGEDQDMNSRR